jgi:hypothetical protein
MNLNLILTILLIFWLFVLSGIVIWILLFFIKLSKEVNKGSLVKILENVLKEEDLHAKDISDIKKIIQKIEEDDKSHLQKFALLRFNPFEELGGDQSFSLAILNGKGDGFVITGLHTRERTRIYVKNILRGKSAIELSKEEEKVLKVVQKKGVYEEKS